MSESRREILFGYLLDALEPSETMPLEKRLVKDPALRQELTEARQELMPLSMLCGYYDEEPPEGLADRTCHNLWACLDAEEETDREIEAVTFPFAAQPIIQKEVVPKKIAAGVADSVFVKAVSVPPAVSRPPSAASASEISAVTAAARPKSRMVNDSPRFGRSYNLLLSLTLGGILALAAFPALLFVKNRVVAFVFQHVARDIGEGYGYINQIQNFTGSPEIVEKPRGFDPNKATWHQLDYASVDPAIRFNPVALAMQDAPPPVWSDDHGNDAGLLLAQAAENDSPHDSELASFDTMEFARVPLLEHVRAPGSGIPVAWHSQIGAENNLLVGCRQGPEIIRGQNVMLRDNHLFLRNFPLKSLPVTFNYYLLPRYREEIVE